MELASEGFLSLLKLACLRWRRGWGVSCTRPEKPGAYAGRWLAYTRDRINIILSSNEKLEIIWDKILLTSGMAVYHGGRALKAVLVFLGRDYSGNPNMLKLQSLVSRLSTHPESVLLFSCICPRIPNRRCYIVQVWEPLSRHFSSYCFVSGDLHKETTQQRRSVLRYAIVPNQFSLP